MVRGWLGDLQEACVWIAVIAVMMALTLWCAHEKENNSRSYGSYNFSWLKDGAGVRHEIVDTTNILKFFKRQ